LSVSHKFDQARLTEEEAADVGEIVRKIEEERWIWCKTVYHFPCAGVAP